MKINQYTTSLSEAVKDSQDYIQENTHRIQALETVLTSLEAVKNKNTTISNRHLNLVPDNRAKIVQDSMYSYNNKKNLVVYYYNQHSHRTMTETIHDVAGYTVAETIAVLDKLVNTIHASNESISERIKHIQANEPEILATLKKLTELLEGTNIYL